MCVIWAFLGKQLKPVPCYCSVREGRVGGLYANGPGEAVSGGQPPDRETLQCLGGFIRRGKGTGSRRGAGSWAFTITFSSPAAVLGQLISNVARKGFPQMHSELLYPPASSSAIGAAGGLGQERFQVSWLFFLYLHARRGREVEFFFSV